MKQKVAAKTGYKGEVTADTDFGFAEEAKALIPGAKKDTQSIIDARELFPEKYQSDNFKKDTDELKRFRGSPESAKDRLKVVQGSPSILETPSISSNTEDPIPSFAMFDGGESALKIEKKKISSDEDEEEVFEEGLEIDVNLPRKKVKSLMMLSGGERALTSIALLFAMSSVNPPPFIILDETDAALDEANSRRYGDMIENLSKNSQLILISHNRETMSRAGVIFGITMIDGASKVLSIKFDEAVLIAK